MSKTKYNVSVKLSHTVRWRMRAVHEDVGHAMSFCAFRYFWVRQL